MYNQESETSAYVFIIPLLQLYENIIINSIKTNKTNPIPPHFPFPSHILTYACNGSKLYQVSLFFSCEGTGVFIARFLISILANSMQADILFTISSDLAAYILQSTLMNFDFSFYSISIISALSQPITYLYSSRMCYNSLIFSCTQ